MTLVLHRGAEAVDFDALKAVATPGPTASHIPLPHYQLVEMTRYALGFFGHEIAEETHAVTPDGLRYFGLMTLMSDHGLFTDTLGLRNSNDKAFPIGLAYGAKCFVCDNLSFQGDFTIRRKHTANSKRELPGLVSELIEPLKLQRAAQARTFLTYQQTHLTVQTADHLILEMYRGGILNIQRVPEVMEAFDKPPHEEWGDHSAWTLFNATTAALEGRVVENPSVTASLHKVIDGVCERVAA